MKKWIPLILTVLFAGWIVSTFRGPQDAADEVPLKEFGKLPVSMHGRIQPLDSLARNSMLILRKKQQLNQEPWKGEFGKPKIVPAIHWMAELMMEPETADTRPCFRIDNGDLKTLLNLPLEANEDEKTDGKHFSWKQIEPGMARLKVEATRASQVTSELRDSFERAVLDLSEATALYRSLRAAMGPAESGDLAASLKAYREKFEAGRTAFQNQMEGMPFDQSALDWAQIQINTPLLVPPHGDNVDWSRAIQEIGSDDVSTMHYSLPAYAGMAAAWKKKDSTAFATAVKDYRSKLEAEKVFDVILAKAGREQWFNYVEPFYRGMVISVMAFLLCILVWCNPRKFEWARVSAMSLMGLTFVVLTAGIIWRMYQEGRPPVTNLYSSALFIGWAATLVGLIFERIWPQAVGVGVSAIMGFATLLVAHFLSLDGDTMIMLRAVLDTNFWLATHVVIVTLGYAATFVSGIIGVLYVVRGVFSRYVTREDQRGYARIAFASVCFAMLFSFVGTVLGGIWADQSWGRFWGWDPKENGALIIVIWNALILHARLGGMVKERGLLNLCIFGNIATSWSWFGTNMLGIGLHSYGFMDAAKVGLYSFMGVNVLFILFGCLPQRTWHSAASLLGGSEPKASGDENTPPQPLTGSTSTLGAAS